MTALFLLNSIRSCSLAASIMAVSSLNATKRTRMRRLYPPRTSRRSDAMAERAKEAVTCEVRGSAALPAVLAQSCFVALVGNGRSGGPSRARRRVSETLGADFPVSRFPIGSDLSSNFSTILGLRTRAFRSFVEGKHREVHCYIVIGGRLLSFEFL